MAPTKRNDDDPKAAALRAAFAERLRSLGYTAQQLAGIAKVDETNAYRWLNGESIPQPKNREAIAAHAGVSVRWLHKGEGVREARGAYLQREGSTALPPLTPEQEARALARHNGNGNGNGNGHTPADFGPRYVPVEGVMSLRAYLVTVDGQPDRFIVEVPASPEIPRLEVGDALRAAHVARTGGR